jgi:hypothetical protein
MNITDEEGFSPGPQNEFETASGTYQNPPNIVPTIQITNFTQKQQRVVQWYAQDDMQTAHAQK